jgi:two-component system C4-dicarboxylate transport sensor histidine kinase DctB
MRATRLLPFMAALILALGLGTAWMAGQGAQAGAMARLAASAAADAPLRRALLNSEIARFRLLPLALADDRDVVAARPTGHDDHLSAKLESLVASTGAAVMYVIAPDGHALAASNFRRPDSFVGRDYNRRPYFRDAVATGAGEQFSMGTVSHRPGLYLARRASNGLVVVVKLEFDAIEAQWRRAGGITFVTDADGVVLVASNTAWRFAATRPLAPLRAARARDQAGVGALLPTPYRGLDAGRIAVAGQGYVLASLGADAAGWQLHLALPITASLAGETRPAQIGAALATWGLLALVWLALRRRRRRQEYTAALEDAVATRTADLSREIEERAAAEARAADLREGLRQANRLAALGQITASVAHETAQPVAAIRTYAATSQKLLARGAVAEVGANLAAIARLTERIGAVTGELRGFARKGAGTPRPIALVDAVEGARLLLKERLSRVELVVPPMPRGLTVLGGKVRLEQVLVNVLQNALDALDGWPAPRITLTLQQAGDSITLTIADNGPGVAPQVAQRLFTPFATSRPEGLGLGLVIAADIMADFGGSLLLAPSATGAAFVITLCRA